MEMFASKEVDFFMATKQQKMKLLEGVRRENEKYGFPTKKKSKSNKK